jgi:hypothetical protein
MAAHRLSPVAAPHLAEVPALARVLGDALKGGIQRDKILKALLASELVLGVAGDLFQIGLRLAGKRIPSYQPWPSSSSSRLS